jgi:hypothetical protein
MGCTPSPDWSGHWSRQGSRGRYGRLRAAAWRRNRRRHVRRVPARCCGRCARHRPAALVRQRRDILEALRDARLNRAEQRQDPRFDLLPFSRRQSSHLRQPNMGRPDRAPRSPAARASMRGAQGRRGRACRRNNPRHRDRRRARAVPECPLVSLSQDIRTVPKMHHRTGSLGPVMLSSRLRPMQRHIKTPPGTESSRGAS